jgi:hypothetical protein
MTTHRELVERAAKWLLVRCPVVITEMTSGAPETPDAIGFTGHRSTLVECKTSMADFRADAGKPSRRREMRRQDTTNARHWMGTVLGDYRYYLVAETLADKVLAALEADDSPWGLLVAPIDKRRRLVRRRDALDRAVENTHIAEMSLLVSAVRRIGSARNRHPGSPGWYANVRVYVMHSRDEPRATMGIVPEE